MEYEFSVDGPRYPDFAIVGFLFIPGDASEAYVDVDCNIIGRFSTGYFDKEFAPVIRRGVDLAVSAHKNCGQQVGGKLVLNKFDIWDAATTSAGIECAATAAAWLSLGHSEHEMTIVHKHGCWQVVFSDRKTILENGRVVRTWSGGRYLEISGI